MGYLLVRNLHSGALHPVHPITPRSRNCLNFITDLMIPITGSTAATHHASMVEIGAK